MTQTKWIEEYEWQEYVYYCPSCGNRYKIKHEECPNCKEWKEANKMNKKKPNQRIKDLLYLETCIVHAIHEEIELNLRTGREGDIKERIKYILEEQKIEELL